MRLEGKGPKNKIIYREPLRPVEFRKFGVPQANDSLPLIIGIASLSDAPMVEGYRYIISICLSNLLAILPTEPCIEPFSMKITYLINYDILA